MTQISLIPMLGDDAEEIKRQAELFQEYAKRKTKWEDAFQKWSNLQFADPTTHYGVCGYGDICDYCVDNHYGRPCVRALNATLREKGGQIDYSDMSEEAFERAWFL